MNYSIKVNVLEKSKNSIRAFANVVFGDCFKISNIAIVENKEKGEMFVSMPRYSSSKDGSGYKDICNPITKEFRQELYDNILATFEEASRGGENKKMVGDEKDKSMPFQVQVTPYEREGSNIKGLARIYVNDCFVVNNVSLLEGVHGVFVSMPSYKTKQKDEQGKSIYQDICFPVTKEFREKLNQELRSGLEKAKEKQQSVSRQKTGKEQNFEKANDVPFR